MTLLLTTNRLWTREKLGLRPSNLRTANPAMCGCHQYREGMPSQLARGTSKFSENSEDSVRLPGVIQGWEPKDGLGG
ncbi:hypothetical protein WG66_005911 [Moniliophthora roreri]|nr:hypothetical protein WG66_005911 [Moniliophthora roreri]